MNNILKRANISNYLNCWKLILDNKAYAVIPAHCLIYKKNTWYKSFIANKLSKYETLQWHIPSKFAETLDIYHDFAFSRIETKGNARAIGAINCYGNGDDEEIKFYFYQPFSHTGKISKYATLGRVDGVIYKSPESDLYETIGIGFRGMSGALCINNKKKVSGMYIRRGEDLGVDNNNTFISQVTNNMALSSVPVSRGMIMTPQTMIKHIKGDIVPIDELVRSNFL